MSKYFLHITCVMMLAITTLPVTIPAWMVFQKWLMSFEMKEKLETENLHRLELKKDEIKWYIQDRECIVNNKLFDIKSMSEENGFLIIEGIFDEEETEIENRLSRSAFPLDNERSELIFKFTHIIAESPSPFRIIQPMLTNTTQWANQWNMCITSSHKYITTPPPEA
jgi:hypothetical protein